MKWKFKPSNYLICLDIKNSLVDFYLILFSVNNINVFLFKIKFDFFNKFFKNQQFL